VAASDSFGVSFGVPAHIAGATSTGSGASTTWKVTGLKVKVGDTVKKGAVLATADTADLTSQLADAKTAVTTAKIQLAIAKTDRSNATTTATIRQTRIGVYNAQTQVTAAQKTASDLQTQIDLAKLTAPINGIVTAVNIVNGLDAPSGDAIVIDAPTFQITTNVVESDVASMAVGQPATVSIAAVDATVDGKVTSIAPTATGNTTGAVVNYAVVVSLSNPPANVLAGMTADVTITIDSATGVMTIPAAALRGDTGNYTVLVMGADGTPTAQPVQVGLITNTTAEVKSGLTVGQEVITGVSNPQTTTTTAGGGGFGGGGFGGAFPVTGGRRNVGGGGTGN
jgi:RND family efflux transporter MFP subunit